MDKVPNNKEMYVAIQDVLEAVNTFATHVDGEFFIVKERLDHIEFELSNVKSKVNTLPTKDYLDDKLSDQKANIIQLIQKKVFTR